MRELGAYALRRARAGLTPRVARWLFAGYLLAALVVVLQPLPQLASDSVAGIQEVLQQVGGGGDAGETTIGFALNVVLFFPITFLGALATRTRRPWVWVAIGILGSAGVELFQLVALPERSASVVDLTANSLGALLGALAARAWSPPH